jgi:hypothetical protein
VSGADVNETAFCAVNTREDVTEGFGAHPAHGCHEDICAGDDGVDGMVGGLGLNAVDDGLEVLVWGFAPQESADFLTFFGEGGACV